MNALKQPWWKTQGVFFAGGWEPLTGRIRRGVATEHAEEEYAWEYSEEHILRLKELGIVLLIGQFDRGLGDSDQAEHQDLARRQAELCHKHGLRHGCYLANTVWYESVRKDNPECEDWVAKAYDGQFVNYGGEATFRWVACFNSPGWRARMKRQIDAALDFVKTDWLHFDNLGVWPEPDGCHCPHCQAKFRQYLQDRYPSAEEQKRRFGFTGFDTFTIPNFYMRFCPPWKLDRIQNPLLQEWLDFRCWTVTDYIREMSTYARAKKPDVAIDGNAQSIWGVNQAMLHGVDQGAQSAYLDIVCEENPDHRPEDDPRAAFPVTRKMRGMNYYRRLGKSIMTAFRDEETLAYNLAFAGDPGINFMWGYSEPGRKSLNPHPPGVKELLDHFLTHRELYLQVRSAARTAVWRSKRSLRYVSTDTHLSACVMEHLLFTRRIPFSIVSDEYIDSERLKEFDLLILPDAEWVSDAQAEAIARFVEAGGSVLVTEQSGTMGDLGRRRQVPAFARLFAGSLSGASAQQEESGNFDPNKQFAVRSTAGLASYSRHGRGRAVYLPKIQYVHAPHTFSSEYNVMYDGIDSRYWKEPHNAREILDAVQWLNPACEPVRVYGSSELRLDYVCWPDGSRGVMLFRCGKIGETQDLRFSVLGPQEPASAAIYRPEQTGGEPLIWVQRGERWETVLSGVRRLAVARFR